MRYIVLLGLVLTAACSRKVTLETAPRVVASASIKVTNTAAQAVSVYVTAGGAELFVKSVGANSTEVLPLTGVAAGSTVKLRATLADGSKSYTRDNVALNGVFDWKVP